MQCGLKVPTTTTARIIMPQLSITNASKNKIRRSQRPANNKKTVPHLKRDAQSTMNFTYLPPKNIFLCFSYTWILLPYTSHGMCIASPHLTKPARISKNDNQPRKSIFNSEAQYPKRLSLTLFWQWKRCEICAKNILSGNLNLHPFVFIQMPVRCWYSFSTLIFEEIWRSRVLSVYKHASKRYYTWTKSCFENVAEIFRPMPSEFDNFQPRTCT